MQQRSKWIVMYHTTFTGFAMLILEQDKEDPIQVYRCTHLSILFLKRGLEYMCIYYVHLDRAQAVPVMQSIVPYKYAI